MSFFDAVHSQLLCFTHCLSNVRVVSSLVALVENCLLEINLLDDKAAVDPPRQMEMLQQVVPFVAHVDL